MGLDKKINLVRDDNLIGIISLLCAFSTEEYTDSYIIYAKEDTSINENSNIVYFGKVINKDDTDYLVSISDETELNYVKDSIKELFKYSLELENIKKEKADFNKKLELPENLFVNPYNNKTNNRENKHLEKYKELNEDKTKDNREYRNRLKSLAEDIKNIKPIDKQIPSTLYINYYNEMGMLLKSKLSTLKQLWIEYQLLYNEKQAVKEKKEQEEKEDNNSDINIEKSFPDYPSQELSPDFDSLLDSLSNRINYINNYLDELRELKEDMNTKGYTKTDINLEREKLKQEKKEFEEYKKQEKEKLASDKEELQVHFNKFQSIVETFDKKIKEVE